MYLKSLVLKGFKSFADRSVLALEPGITAIVGPNGSGKSNISDAVLWVLGERNARNLRGQSMEDIIFSGSAARKAVSVAEVELVLDNSDGTLPVEFDDVCIARRMYRSGESEYLINGVVARRMDVLDILHDTGLGTGTHSIISQGSLDSILQSKPEDRRALIEEAAGVLKHKQRKEKSARKLEKMDNHLARVRDVAAEVDRQLGPLERKAKRAQAYKKASAELSELKLAVAVDDLRRLQREWEQICASEAQISQEVEARRSDVADAEQKVGDIQNLIRQKSEDAGELARHQRRVASATERLDSAVLLLRERRRSAQGYEADMRSTLEENEIRRQSAHAEFAQAQQQLQEVQEASKHAEEIVSDLSLARNEAAERRREIEASIEELAKRMRETERELDDAKRRQDLLRENLSSGIAHEKLVDARRSELVSELELAKTASEEANRTCIEAQGRMAELEESERQLRIELGRRFDDLEQARKVRNDAHEASRVLDAESKAVERALRASQSDDPSLVWMIDHAAEFEGDIVPIARVLKAPTNLEHLVENLLGSELAALAVEDAQCAHAAVSALVNGAQPGDVAFVLRHDRAAVKNADARLSKTGHALIDDLTYPESAARIVEALLGDVVVCANSAEAFKAHEQDSMGLRFVSADGCALWPQGKIVVFGSHAGDDEGLLARQRHLEELGKEQQKAALTFEQACEQVASAEEAYRSIQSESLKASQMLAEQKGIAQSAETEKSKANARLEALMREMGDIDRQFESAQHTVAELRPEVEQLAKNISDLESKRVELQADYDNRNVEVLPLRSDAGELGEKLNEARLEAAQLAERKSYASRILEARRNEIAAIDANEIEARRTLALKSVSCERVASVLTVLDGIAETLAKRAAFVEEAVNASDGTTSSYQAASEAAHEAVRAARDAYDGANDRMMQVRVEKGRLEVQVEAAANVVVHDCDTPLEKADEVPALEDRAAAEDALFALERRIKNMGAINPDAAEEYESLKERYDFLAGQLEDMEEARKSLAKIVRIIDKRMKEDFARTFEAVNANFAEIFSILFPGGTASLVLEDPDDMEHTGVEVTAQPRGKRITKMMLMSGGEKSLTALALLFAVYRIRSTPFYILDEVEAALDDTNLRRLVSYIDTLRETTQLIMITHQRRTMETADVLFGVSMQADGVTKVISQKLERALENAE